METGRSPLGVSAVAATTPHLSAQATLPAAYSLRITRELAHPLPRLGEGGWAANVVVRTGQPSSSPQSPTPNPLALLA